MKNYYKGTDFWKESKPEDKRIEYPMNESVVKEAEELWGVRLPKSYIQLLHQQNGGELTFPYFDLDFEDVEEEEPFTIRHEIRYIEGICFENDDISIMSSKELLEEELLERGGISVLSNEFVVLWSDYHHWLVLDYRTTKQNPPVLFIFEDYSEDEITWNSRKIGDTFDEFSSKLFRSPYVDPRKL